MNRNQEKLLWVIPVVLLFVAAIATLIYIDVNQIGPPWFWASDLCPRANVTCGIMPISYFAVLIGNAVAVSIWTNIWFNIVEET